MGYAASKEFPYELKEIDNNYSGKSIFTLHRGLSKEDGSAVSIFRFEKTDQTDLGKVENCSKRLKLIRHPNILRYITSTDLPNAYFIVTEPVSSIYECIDEINNSPEWCAWGLSQIITALDFLGQKQCNLVHCNINLNSIFITKAGDWKLGGMELVGEPQDKYFTNPSEKSKFISSIPRLYRPPETASQSWKGPSFGFDIYQTAALIYQLYNRDTDIQGGVPSTQNIPKGLIQTYNKMLNANEKARVLFENVLNCSYFQNSLIEACTFIENIALKDPAEKDTFFKALEPMVDTLPPVICKYKFLPLLVRALDFGSANSKVLAPILKIGTLLSDEEYTESVTPSVAKWFESPDRNLRLNLLQNLSSFANHLPKDLINSKIYPLITQGFLDTNETIRELTVVSIVHIIAKLDERHITTTLLKSLAKLQIDPIPKIRTNTTICLGKISSYIPAAQRQQILIPAFSRALQDPFLHARLAGILSFSATQQFYAKEEIARKIVPALSPLTIDPEQKVRQSAFSTIKAFLSKLETLSEGEEAADGGNAATSSSTQATSNPSMFGWVSSISNKIYTPTTTATSASPPPSRNNATNPNSNNNTTNKTIVNNNSSGNNNTKLSASKPSPSITKKEEHAKSRITENKKNHHHNNNNKDDDEEKEKNKLSSKKLVADEWSWDDGNEEDEEEEVHYLDKNSASSSKWDDDDVWEDDFEVDHKFSKPSTSTTTTIKPDNSNKQPQSKPSSLSSPSSSSSLKNTTAHTSLKETDKPKPHVAASSQLTSKVSAISVVPEDDNNDGWGDWEDTTPAPNNNNNKIVVETDGWDDSMEDDWSTPLSSPKKSSVASTAVSSKLSVPVTNTTSDDGWNDDWDDFDNKPVEKKLSKMELNKMKKEMKKQTAKKD